jgi:hypothetical protein
MSWSRLKSLTGLLLTGFALISIPLLLTVVTSAVKIRDLSAASANLVRSGVEATHHSQQLVVRMGSFERSAKVYSALNSEEVLLRGYQQSRWRLLATLMALERVAKDAQRVGYIQELRDALRDIDVLLSQPPTSEARGTPLARVDSMWRIASKLSKATADQIETGLQRLQQSTSDAQQFLFWQSVCLAASTAGLVALFTVMLLGRSRKIEATPQPGD